MPLFSRGRGKKQELDEITYSNRPIMELSDADLQACSNLYSENYGVWGNGDKRVGRAIKMGVSHYKRNYYTNDYFIAMARSNNLLIGHALYLRKRYAEYGIMTWVVQLVVDRNYRNHGIASTMLRSIWGFSDDFAWGLATANPCTVKTLESATFRKCKPKVIQSHLKEIKLIGKDIPFVKSDSFEVTNQSSQVNSKFIVDNSEYRHINEIENRLGRLRLGREWLAFTFQNQSIQQDVYQKKFEDMVRFSEIALKDAYSRMDMQNQGWAKRTEEEVDYLKQTLSLSPDMRILDLGCGTGRHCIELASRGYQITGIDFSEENIRAARKKIYNTNISSRCQFICKDIRQLNPNQKYDAAICLYDVIGSFPNETDNIKLIQAAYRGLKKNSLFICSVMNMELTKTLIHKEYRTRLKEHPEILQKLPPSHIMQNTGQIFDPDYLAMDTESGLIFRKEQFSYDNSLPSEYVIRDKRYTKDEIADLLCKVGFQILDTRYVRAGFFDEPLNATDSKAKEILVLAKKI